MRSRKTLWLIVNGETNTLRRHLINAGYREAFESTIAKRCKCKPSEIPLDVISDYLGAPVQLTEMPDDWQVIMYGSKRGAQKNTPVSDRSIVKRCPDMTQSERIEEFLTMRLTPNPSAGVAYY